MKLIEHQCEAPSCENVFERAFGSKKRTCSATCNTKLWRIEKKAARSEPLSKRCALPSCNEVIHREKEVGRPKLFCCDEHMRRNYYDKNFGMTSAERVTTCAYDQCEGVKFFVKSHGHQKFCCDECRVLENNRKRSKSARAAVPKPKIYKHQHTCHNCGSKFGSNTKVSKFCTKSCRNLFWKQHRNVDWVNIGMTFDHTDGLSKTLSGEIFIDCTFTDFDFSDSELTKAKFIRCTIESCHFIDCWLDGTKFIDCEWIDKSYFEGSLLYDTNPSPQHAVLKNIKTLKEARTVAFKRQSNVLKQRVTKLDDYF